MRLLCFIVAFAVGCGTCALADPQDDSTVPVAGSSASKPAPADEYFGRLKMSILGIRNQLTHLTKEVQERPGESQNALGTLALTEESVKEWEQKYPRDPWLAKTVYALVHVYAKMPPEIGHAGAVKTLAWLLAKYPDSEFTEAALADVHPASGEPAASGRP